MRKILPFILVIAIYIVSNQNVRSQSVCSDVLSHGAGFSTSIESVVFNGLINGEESHTITLRVENDGCTDPECKSLNHYAVEALSGTYSDISHATIAGNITYGGINLGPNLGTVPFDGFRISNVNGIGNGLAGIFTVTYTLSGGLQPQQMHIKASGYEGIVEFQIEDFQNVLNCYASTNIIPYIDAPENGKLENSLIGAELTSLHYTFEATDSASTNDIFQIVNLSNVVIEIFALDGQYDQLLTLLQTSQYGLTDVKEYEDELRITGVFPIDNLLLINDLPQLVNYARPVYPGAPQRGLVTTQGDTSMLSFIAREGFRVKGSGVKVGVLSDSYSTKFNGTAAADDVQRGDLPGSTNSTYTQEVDVLLDYPYGVASDEGRAMLQIIHDIAPDAELAFRTGLISPVDFANGILELQQAGCDVIVDDITYISEPFLRDGVVAQAVDNVVDLGVSYFTAAGNFGNKSYENAFNAGSTPAGLGGPAHNFASTGSEDIYQNITVYPGNYTIVLQWDDGTGNELTPTDLDIYLANDDGSRLFGFNRENIGGAPIEVLPFTVLDTASTNIVIINNAGPDPENMKYIVFRGEVSFNEYFNPAASTVVGQANSESAITVGAVFYEFTPAFGVNPPTIASFSSLGGTLIDGINRNKPDLTGPNGVNTTVWLGGPESDYEGDNFPNFFGTSASAPHVAGVAALLLEAKEKFYGIGETISPADMKSILQSTAVDMETPGQDNKSGAGLVNAVDALLTLASPSPLITDIIYDTSLVPGEDTIQLSVIGQYLTGESQIYFNGVPLSTATIVEGDTVTGTILPFTDRYPAIQVYNPPNAQTNGNDGGLSNPLYFSTKPTIIININDTSKLYAETVPEFTAEYSIATVDNVFDLEGGSLLESEVARIRNIELVTIASDTSNVGLWAIEPSPNDPLNPLSGVAASDPLDTTLLYYYDFEFTNGLMSVAKLDLTIIPKDTVIAYGDSLTGFDYYYIYNNDTINPDNNVPISEPVDLAVLNAVKQSHATALVNAVATVRATALVNGEPILDSAELANTSFFVSNAVVSQRATALVNGTLLNALELSKAVSSSSATALVNAVAMVRATALVNGAATIMAYGTATALVNFGALVNGASVGSSSATALVNGDNINENSNQGTVVILDESDVLILSNDSIGEVALSSISVITDNNVGEHLIIPGAFISNNFNISYGLGTITIQQAPATVTANTDFIYAGDSLPEFTASYSGFVNGDNDSVVTSLSFTLSPAYNGLAGTYDIVPTATAENYVFTSEPGTLYVNPSGPGTKHIKTSLQCVDELLYPDSLGHTFIAYFEYENDNTTDVYIPIGADNELSGLGSFHGPDQPVVFAAGGGSWTATFDGNKLTWTVASYKHNGHKTSVASNASSTSGKCNKSEEIEGDITSGISEISVYPNPFNDIVYIEFPVDAKSSAEVYVYDIFGRLQAPSISGQADQRMEIKMAGLRSGLYLIKLIHGEEVEVVRIVKK